MLSPRHDKQTGWAALLVAVAVFGAGAEMPALAQGADPVAAEPPKVRITKKDCKRIIRHQPSADVAYKPGIDVRGNPVAAADVGGGFTIPIPDVFEFNITKDLTAYLDGPEEQLAAEKAAAIAAERSVTATNAAVSSAETAVTEAQAVYDDAVAAAEATAAASEAAPNDTDLAAAATSAQAKADAAATGLATTQTAYSATQTAATSDDVTGALAGAQSALAAAEATATAAGLDADAVSAATADTSAAVTEATQAASESAAADTAALQAMETVSKSSGMTLNVGTVRYNINTGAMTFNGKPLNDASEAELAEKCRAMMGAK